MKKHFFILLSLIFTFCGNAYSIQTISVNRGHHDPIPIAINNFDATDGTNKLAQQIVEVMKKDLSNSGLFKPLPTSSFLENKSGINNRPSFPSWRQIGTNILVNGMTRKLDNGNIEICFIMWDVVAEKDIIGEVFELPASMWRKVAHQIADKVYERIIGDKGYFDTRIVYVSESGSARNKIKRIAIMDYDGENHSFLTDGRNLVLTPRFSPQANKIMYLAYVNRKARVHLKDLSNGNDYVLGNFEGMSFAPRFSPDGKKAIMSIAKNGSTHLVELDLNSMKYKKLTSGYNVIDTSPSYSPDGKRILFNSDRNGTRQLYIMDRNGSNVQRISYGEGSYASPIWSPRGDYLAFTKIFEGEFSIGVMKPDGNNERIITSGYLKESPSWAPNGSILIYSSSTKPHRGEWSTKLNSIDLTGINETVVTTPKDGSDPEWSYKLGS